MAIKELTILDGGALIYLFDKRICNLFGMQKIEETYFAYVTKLRRFLIKKWRKLPTSTLTIQDFNQLTGEIVLHWMYLYKINKPSGGPPPYTTWLHFYLNWSHPYTIGEINSYLSNNLNLQDKELDLMMGILVGSHRYNAWNIEQKFKYEWSEGIKGENITPPDKKSFWSKIFTKKANKRLE